MSSDMKPRQTNLQPQKRSNLFSLLDEHQRRAEEESVTRSHILRGSHKSGVLKNFETCQKSTTNAKKFTTTKTIFKKMTTDIFFEKM